MKKYNKTRCEFIMGVVGIEGKRCKRYDTKHFKGYWTVCFKHAIVAGHTKEEWKKLSYTNK